MNRRFGPSLFYVSLLALLLMPSACWSEPQVKADAAYAKKIEAMLAPKVECVASSPSVISGRSVTLTARVEAPATGLVYSFSSNGGRLYPDGSMARLDTTGVSAGRTISATCQVTNAAGRRGSANAVVRVVAQQAAKAWDHAPVADLGIVGAKNTLGEMGGSAQDEIHPKSSHEHVAEAAQGAKDQAAAADQAVAAQQQQAAELPPVTAAPPVAAAAAAPAPPPAAAGGGPSHHGEKDLKGDLALKDPYAESEAQARWVDAIKNGKLERLIPSPMKLHETSVVTVILHGFAYTGPNQLAGAPVDTLKVSPYMRLQLTADNPDEFDIKPMNAAILPVPIDGSAKWTWNVVPKQPAKDQKLTIEAFMVRTETGDHPEELLPSYSATVNVDVPGLWESARDTFWNDPTGAIKYVLPGGAGFTALAGLTVWWWKRRHPEEDKPKKDE